MTISTRLRRGAAAAVALGMLAAAAPTLAQDVPATHLRAARAAVSALQTTNQFDMILPEAALALKAQLIQKNPDLVSAINRIVDQQAIALAARRGDLEREAALIFARNYTEAELGEIASFFGSATGRKLLENDPIVTREVFRAADIWQTGISRDLAQNVGDALEAEVGSANVDTNVEAAPAQGQ